MADYIVNGVDYTTLAQKAGFTGVGLTDVIAISKAEDTTGNPFAVFTNTTGTRDRGVMQINNFFHPEVTDECAFDPACSFQAAYKISSSGTNFSQWATFDSGAYLQYLGNSSIINNSSNMASTIASIPAATTSSTSNLTSTIASQPWIISGLFIVGGGILAIIGFTLIFRRSK